jgi:hypothetical protein
MIIQLYIVVRDFSLDCSSVVVVVMYYCSFSFSSYWPIGVVDHYFSSVVVGVNEVLLY